MIKHIVSMLAVVSMLSIALPSTHASTGIKAFNTTAGQKAMLVLSGEAGASEIVSITDPLGNKASVPFVYSEKGGMTIFHKNTARAGLYLAKTSQEVAEFTVKAATPALYRLTLSEYSKRVDVGFIEGSYTVQDIYKNAITNKKYQISTRKNQVNCGNCITNKDGQIHFTIQGFQPGFDNLTVKDPLSKQVIKQEEIAFLPPSTNQVAQNGFKTELSAPSDFVQVYEESDVNTLLNAGSNDSLLSSLNLQSISEFLGAQALEEPDPLLNSDELEGIIPDIEDIVLEAAEVLVEETISEPETLSAAAVVIPVQNSQEDDLYIAPDNPHFRIYFGETFDTADIANLYSPNADVDANLAQSFTVVAMDRDERVITDYEGTITFSISSVEGSPLVPGDYTFNLGDQGKHTFQLSMIFPDGVFEFTAEDRNDTEMSGEISVTAAEARQAVNQTSISLTPTAPAAGTTLAGSATFIGTVSHENIQITIKQGSTQMAQVNVDESKSYSIPVDFTDGEHTVDIVAKYLPDNSTTTSSLTFSVDTTAPVVTSVSDIATDIKVAEDFNITVVSEPGATITAFINNQAYPFPASASGTFVLNAKAPLDTGSFPVTIEAMDQFGNKTTVQEPTTLKVVSGIPGLTNLIGIPEEGAISLTWDALPGAAGYKIEVKSGGQTLSTETASASNYTVSQLNNGTQYTLTVRAIDVSGADASLPSSTIALEPLVLSAAAGDDGSASLIAQDQPLPPRHTNSGPEVYFIIALSILMLDFYARARRKLMD